MWSIIVVRIFIYCAATGPSYRRSYSRFTKMLAKFEILNEYDRSGVIQNILQPLFAGAKRPAVWTFATPPNGVRSAEIAVQAAAV
jgi:hypothetical protein